MRLYTRTGAIALTDPDTGIVYAADADGGFDFPDDLSDTQHRFAVHGKPIWETQIERQQRLIGEELERRKDPATLLSAVEQIMRAAQAVSTPAAPAAPAAEVEVSTPAAPVEAPAPVARKRAASKRAAAAPAPE